MFETLKTRLSTCSQIQSCHCRYANCADSIFTESDNILNILALYVISYIPKEAPMINVFVDIFILCDREKFGDIPASRSARCDQVLDVYNAKLLILAVLLCCIYQSVTRRFALHNRTLSTQTLCRLCCVIICLVYLFM